jgi:predicted hydrocarbon binding protein
MQDTMDEEDYLLKGTVFVNLIKYIKERRGQKGVDHIFNLLKKETPEFHIEPTELKTKEMYPELTFLKLLEIVDREFGEGDLTECYNFGYYDSHHLGVAGFFISFIGKPSTVIKKAPKSWKYYHNLGELVVTKEERGLAVIELRDYLANKVACTEILGYLKGAGEQTKAKSTSVKHTRCRAYGDPVCEFTITWDEF